MANVATLEPNRGGRPKGAKDKAPRISKASVKRAYERIGRLKPDAMFEAIDRGLAARPRDAFPYVQLGAHYIDGKPADTVKLEGGVAIGVGWLGAPPPQLEQAREIVALAEPVIEAKVLEVASHRKVNSD